MQKTPAHLEEDTIRRGEMLFFEGARLRHGRPFPVEGNYYASMFLHYTPLDCLFSADEPDS